MYKKQEHILPTGLSNEDLAKEFSNLFIIEKVTTIREALKQNSENVDNYLIMDEHHKGPFLTDFESTTDDEVTCRS